MPRRAEPRELCERCQDRVPTWDISHLGGQMLCGRCFNKDFARALEIDFPEAELQPVVLTSRRGKRHTFQFRVRLTPGGQVVEAFEVKRGERGGYQFKVLGDFEADTFELLARLYERIHRALGRQEIPTHHGMPHLPVGGHVRGRIDHDRHADTPLIVVDGRAMSWQEFGLLWNTVEGFQFRLELVNSTDEA